MDVVCLESLFRKPLKTWKHILATERIPLDEAETGVVVSCFYRTLATGDHHVLESA
jgi:hypothetical protein